MKCPHNLHAQGLLSSLYARAGDGGRAETLDDIMRMAGKALR